MKRYLIITVIVVLLIALIGTGTWGYMQYQDKENYYKFIDNQVSERYYELVGSVETITAELSKLMVSNQTKENIVIYSKIWQNAYNAEENMAQIPIDHQTLSKSDKFLNQLGDYTFAMAQKSIKGEKLSQEDVNNLQKLYEYALDLTSMLREIKEDAVGEKVWTDNLKRKRVFKLFRQQAESEGDESPLQAQFSQFEERLNDYPELIYDGPFSEHVLKDEQAKLQGEKITIEQAEEKARAFIGNDKIESLERLESTKGDIVTFNFTVKVQGYEEQVYVQITEIKGYTVYVLNNRNIEKANFSRKQAIETADKFLKEKGYENMMPTYSLKTDNTVLINYASVQDGVVMYPDLIKVKVALDNGDIVGFDSAHYLTLNHQREIHPPSLTPQEAKQRVSVRATIEEEPQLCYIPTEFGSEIYCYEIKVNRGDEHFLVYINADTGVEEKILKAVISENGTLMI